MPPIDVHGNGVSKKRPFFGTVFWNIYRGIDEIGVASARCRDDRKPGVALR